MLSWFRRNPKRQNEIEGLKRIAAAVPVVVPAYGALMERYPNAILDTSKLPLPKADMKLALQLAWRQTTDVRLRQMIEAAYLHLSHFQDSVGEAQIDPTLPADADPGMVARGLDPFIERSERMLDETRALAAEFTEFKQQY